MVGLQSFDQGGFQEKISVYIYTFGTHAQALTNREIEHQKDQESGGMRGWREEGKKEEGGPVGTLETEETGGEEEDEEAAEDRKVRS